MVSLVGAGQSEHANEAARQAIPEMVISKYAKYSKGSSGSDGRYGGGIAGGGAGGCRQAGPALQAAADI